MSEVQLIKKEVEVTKEASEIFYAMAELIKDIKAKKSVAEIGQENLSNLFAAVQGFEMLDDEVKHKAFYKTAGLGMGEIAEALIEKPGVPVA